MMIGESFFNVDSDHANEFITEQRQASAGMLYWILTVREESSCVTCVLMNARAEERGPH